MQYEKSEPIGYNFGGNMAYAGRPTNVIFLSRDGPRKKPPEGKQSEEDQCTQCQKKARRLLDCIELMKKIVQDDDTKQ